MFNPFEEKIEDNENDIFLINNILNGSKVDLEKLIFRHQAWIYNIALKMVMDPADAEDVTQEILIKLISKLSSYDEKKGAFRTWLYRIVANHVINMKKKKYEYIFTSFEECSAAIEEIPDQGIDSLPEHMVLIEELKIKCWTGMLLCLDRRQRLAFILGSIFDVTDSLGSEVLEISKVNFRQILSRARKKIHNFMNQNCGLINQENPCHCAKKIKGYIENGFIQPDNIMFYKNNFLKIKDIVKKNRTDFDSLADLEKMILFQEHPFYSPPDFKEQIATIFHNDGRKEVTTQDLNS
jgi:RNA polymerase sigma factor (sigma-70 family)